jgi:hypothetical protein
MAGDPKQQRERQSGTVKPPERERTTSSRSLADREREETSFDGPAPRERVTGTQPTARPSAPPERERVTQKMGEVKPRVTGSFTTPSTQPGAVTQPKALTTHQKQMLSSAFQDAARMQALKSVVGNTGESRRDEADDDDEATTLGARFDGTTPAPELTARDLFKAVQAPVQSREGRRSKNLYQQVIQQFAIGHNPRYEPDGPGQPRGHIYVWDVSRAMNCEVPHFVGTKELTLAQTCDWIRHEGPARGWRRAAAKDAVKAAQAGQLVLVLPKEVRLKQVGVVLPAAPDADGRPRVAAAAVKMGANLSVYEALGVFAAEYFVHA